VLKKDITTMNNYVIDCGPFCLLQQAENAMEALQRVAMMSSFIKPGISDPSEWVFRNMGNDTCVGAYKDLELRAYRLDNTINVETLKYNIQETLKLQNIKYIY
jgi:hypothetical protein